MYVLTSIKIAQFRAITDTLELKNLAKVNYLVGENGSGKSSIIDLLAKRVNVAIEWPGMFQLDEISIVSPSEDSNTHKKYLYETYYITNDKVQTPDNYNNNCNRDSISAFREICESLCGGYPEDVLDKNYKTVNKLRAQLGLKEWKPMSPQSFTLCGIHLTAKSSLEIGENNNIISIDKVASGLQQLLGHRKAVHNLVYDINDNRPPSNTLMIICIEEPEINLHPKYQKELPAIYDSIDFKNVQFFISTHSPFVISAASEYKDQRVYLLENGAIKKPEGYTTSEARGIVAILLGAQVNDIAPEKVVVVDGETTEQFLKKINERFYNQSIRFLIAGTDQSESCGGDDAVVKYAKICAELSDKQTILFPGSKVLFLIDQPNNAQNRNTKYMNALEKCKKTCRESFIESNYERLEDGYPLYQASGSKLTDAKNVGNNITKEEFEDKYIEFKKIFSVS